jgi:choline dehydrogenase-like flavoprotein
LIQDSRAIPADSVIEADLCIIGGGPAGITIARQFMNSGVKVVLLESGGRDVDPETQSLYRGENVGLHYERLDANRSRFLGGSSNCWGGWCREFDEIDFEQRSYIENSGWPFSRATLEPFYQRAGEICEVKTSDYTLEGHRAAIEKEGLAWFPVKEPITSVVNQFSPPTRFGIVYGNDLETAANIQTLLFANVTELETDPEGRTVTGVKVATLAGGRFRIKAPVVVLSAGGLENARLLLASNAVKSAGLGNDHDVVGRYFQDHIRVRSLRITLKNQLKHRRLYDQSLALARRRLSAKHLGVNAHLAPTPEAQRAMGLPNSRTYLVADYFGSMTAAHNEVSELREMIRARRKFGTSWTEIGERLIKASPVLSANLPNVVYGLYDSMLNPHKEDRIFHLETVFEPTPYRDSRVKLSGEKDRIGVPIVQLDWQIAPQDKEHFTRTVAEVAGALQSADLAVLIDPIESAADAWEKEILWCWHHMGTTRMHADPKFGVVDADCKVHGVSNLYVGGGSLFPTVSSDIPTVTIVALALRLSERLRQELSNVRQGASEELSCRSPALV